jgi:hypothetical protein
MLAGGVLWFAGIRRKKALWKNLQLVILPLLFTAVGILGCGGGGSGSSGSGNGGGSTTPTAQTYTVTITATAGSATQTAKYTLTVQ